jgi:hypothetical protein
MRGRASTPAAWVLPPAVQQSLRADRAQPCGDAVMRCLSSRPRPPVQDAIKCDWEEFIKSMPHLETKIQDDNSYANGKLVFRMKPLVPVHDRKMFILSFTVNSRQDLWRVCHKAPSAVMEFPDMEFEIGADAKRKIDSLYNHIAAAVYNLSMHVSTLGAQLSEDTKDKISEVLLLIRRAFARRRRGAD